MGKNQTINMEWSLRRGPREDSVCPPTRTRRPRREHAPGRASLATRTGHRPRTLLRSPQKTGCGFGAQRKGRGDTVKRGKTNSPGRVVLVQNKRPSRSRPATLSSALTYHGVPARRARALRTEADSGVEVEWRRLCAAAEQELE